LPTIDVIFPVLHGTYGEDGTVQGLLEMANLPYVGCGVLASAVAMDKAVAKQLFAQVGLRQAAYEVVLRRQWRNEPGKVIAQLEAALPYPMFVKPANLGSSVGISKVHDHSELAPALDLACRYDRKLIIEQGIPNAREVEVSVLGNDEPIVSGVGEIVPANEFYDYAAKYLTDDSKLLIPAPVSPAIAVEVQAMALKAFRTVDGSGLARVDFLLDNASQTLYLNEINTIPGFTRHSMYPKLWEATGVSYPELVDRLLALALERYEDRAENCTTRE
jgi:D-alanine-D-alanine ligase